MPKAITYVGKKPSRADTVAGTGLVWKPGEVHVVTEAVASQLLTHPDIWAEVSLEEAMVAKQPEVTDVPPKKPKAPEIPTQFERVNVRDMGLNALRDYARSHLNMVLPSRITEETARRKVNEALKAAKLRSREA